MSNYIYYNGELYHFGVKGMKWGVRRSPEVQAVNKRYKEELKPHKKELNRKNRDVSIKKLGYKSLIGDSTILDVGAYLDKRKNRKEYKNKKKELQEKYEPEFQKAKQAAEKRITAEKNTPEAIAKRKATGKKAAVGALATVGVLAASAISEYTLKQQYGISTMDAIKIAIAAAKL